jgi:hypothetical protein
MSHLEVISGKRHVWVYSRWELPWLFLRETFYFRQDTIFHYCWDDDA